MSKPKILSNEANLLLEKHLAELGLEFLREYKFHRTRKWRFDYALLPINNGEENYAIEIEGGVWSQGRHTRGSGMQADMIKYREAAAMGFYVFRFSTDEVLNGTAREFIERHCT